MAEPTHGQPGTDGQPLAQRWRWWQPRYELGLVREESPEPPILVWSRHRSRRLAQRSLRLENGHLRVAPARLVLTDRRTERVFRRS